MKIVIVGGGKVGFYLARHFHAQGDRVTLIEKEADRSRRLADVLNVLVIHGEGSDLSVLADAGAQDADVVAVVTGKDEDNLVTAQLVKEHFEPRRLVVRINNPANEPIFHILGIDLTVSSTGVITRLIEEEAAPTELRTLATFHKGEVQLVQGTVSESSPVVDKSVAAAAQRFPGEMVFVAFIRDDEVLIPRGESVIRVGDKVVVMCDEGYRDEVEALLLGRNP